MKSPPPPRVHSQQHCQVLNDQGIAGERKDLLGEKLVASVLVLEGAHRDFRVLGVQIQHAQQGRLLSAGHEEMRRHQELSRKSSLGGDGGEGVLFDYQLESAEAFAANGTLSAVKDLLLEPRSRVVGLLDNSVYFGGTFQQNGGYLRVTSSIPVGSYALFGGNNKDNEQYLSAIEGQKPLQ